jgi:predicted RNA-binding Zn-ribbon protein involved in translation (DUF1610 family)
MQNTDNAAASRIVCHTCDSGGGGRCQNGGIYTSTSVVPTSKEPTTPNCPNCGEPMIRADEAAMLQAHLPSPTERSHLANVRLKRVLSDHDYGNREVYAEVIVHPGETEPDATTRATQELDGRLAAWVEGPDAVEELRSECRRLRNRIYRLQRIQEGLEVGEDEEPPEDFEPEEDN